jgi:hypothetical protein
MAILFYTILFNISLLLCYSRFDKNARIIENRITFSLFFLLLLLLAGFRMNTGTDYENYYRIFYDKTLQLQLEIGFQWLINLTNAIHYNSFNLFIFLVASISITLKYFYFKQLKYPSIGLVIYVGYFYHGLEYNIIRQGLAVSLILYSINCIRTREFLKFILLVTTASLFHISALIFLPAYFVVNIKLNVKRLILYVIIFLVIRLLFLNMLLNIMLDLTSKMDIDPLSTFLSHLQYYILDNIRGFITFGMIRRIVVIAAYIMLLDKFNITSITFKLYFFGFLVYILFMGNDILSARLALNYEICMIPMFANADWKKTFRSYCMLSLVFCVVFSLLVYTVFTGPRMQYYTFLF